MQVHAKHITCSWRLVTWTAACLAGLWAATQLACQQRVFLRRHSRELVSAQSGPRPRAAAALQRCTGKFSRALLYAYSSSERCDRNARFFVDYGGLQAACDTLFLFVINGDSINFDIPALPNVRHLTRPNVGWDFGGHAAGLAHLEQELGPLDDPAAPSYYGFINCGMTGPLLPAYVAADFDWFGAFAERIDDSVKLVGTYITCLPEDDAGGEGPHVEGHSFFTDQVGLAVLRQARVFRDHATFREAVVNGEWAMTPAIFAAGYTIDCLLYKYQGVDWRDEWNWNCNDRRFVGRPGDYDGVDVDPFETIFFKSLWGNLEPGKREVRLQETIRYIKWRSRWEDGSGALATSQEPRLFNGED